MLFNSHKFLRCIPRWLSWLKVSKEYPMCYLWPLLQRHTLIDCWSPLTSVCLVHIIPTQVLTLNPESMQTLLLLVVLYISFSALSDPRRNSSTCSCYSNRTINSISPRSLSKDHPFLNLCSIQTGSYIRTSLVRIGRPSLVLAARARCNRR